MKKALLIFLFFSYLSSYAQVGINTATPGAILDVQSQESGILIPRLTTTQIEAIATPTESELLYNSTIGAFQYWKNQWVLVDSPQNIEQTLNVGNTVTNNNSLNFTAYDTYVSNTTALYFRTQMNGTDSTQMTAEGLQTVSASGGGFSLTTDQGSNFGKLSLNGLAGNYVFDLNGFRRTLSNNNYTELVYENPTGTGKLIIPNVANETDTLATHGFIAITYGKLINLTTTEINAITSPEVGKLYYNTTTKEIVFHNGISWKKISNTDM